jgi:hypothetical protein
MDNLQTLKKIEYEWLLSDDKIAQEYVYTDFQEGKEVDTLSLSFPFKLSRIDNYSPIIRSVNLYSQTKYDIVNSIDDNLEMFIAKRISQISEVEYILLTKKDDYYEIWTIINKLDRGVRDKIYDIEYNILEHFEDKYFDFHVICRNDKSIKEICPPNYIIFYRKTA